MSVRTRFAPSPTGYLHIGGARTALFSWLFARAQGGTFVLRVEDTDLARSTQASVDMLIRDLHWLGLDWDEGPTLDSKGSVGALGPYFQSRRLDIYAKHLDQLKAKGLVYASFETKEEVQAEKEAALREGRTPSLVVASTSEAETTERLARGELPAWRFRVPEGGVTEFEDLVHGHMRFENKLMNDFVIVRSDGVPTYNFAATVDDALMRITHVIRGDDHLSNTPRQVLLYQALGLGLPKFAHIPMILGPDKQRLSKRHGATAVGEYEAQGYLPEALINFLALLGWSLDDKTTLISRDELVKNFSLERVTKHAAVFDTVKLQWMNGQYVKQADVDRLTQLTLPHFERAGLQGKDNAWMRQLVAALQDKVRTLAELPAENAFFFSEVVTASDEAKAKFLAADGARLAPLLAKVLSDAPDFSEAALEPLLRGLVEKENVKFKDIVAVLRLGTTGLTVTPGIFATLVLLGRESCVRRLSAAAQWKGLAS